MFSVTSVKDALKVDVALSAPMVDALQTWALMYENKATWLTTDIKSLNLPAAIASEIARATTLEMAVEITGSPRAVYLAAQLGPVLNKLREKVEVGAAKGGLMLKPWADVPNQRIVVDFVQADQFYPVTFDANGDITACIFVDSRQVGERFYTRLEFHQLTPGGIVIRNQAFRSDSKETLGHAVELSEVEAWAALLPEATVTGMDRPIYAYFRFPLANNVDPASPLGVSCYSRAVEQIEQADRQWSRLLWEFESGERALYVDVLAFGKDADGKPILPNKKLYRALNSTGNVGEETFFEDWTPTIREANFLAGLNDTLKRIEYTCGLAYGSLSDPNAIEKTATEIAASKQRSQATITDTQKALQRALDHLIYVMDFWSTLYRLAPAGAYKTAFDWDDSLIVDSEMQFSQDSRAVGMGAMPKWMFLVRNYGLTEKTAKEWIAEQQAEQPQDLFQGEQGV